MPWWRTRSWGRDLDALTRLHKGLLALDTTGGEAQPLSAPALLAPPDQETAAQDGARAGETDQERPPLDRRVKPRRPGEAAGSAGTPEPGTPEPGTPEPGTPELETAEQPAAAGPQAEAGSSPQAAGAQVDPAIAAIKETFRYVAEAGDNAVGYFYGQLFARQPGLRQLFPPAMDEQRDRLFRALGQIVESLATPEEMAAYLSQLGRDHRKYRVEPQMYEAVGAALLATLRSFAKDAFTAEAEQAWTAVYTAGSSLMIKAAEEDAASGPATWAAEVVQVDHRAENIAVLTIAPDQPLLFAAGQHITVQTPRWPQVWRPYSIASRPRDDGLLTLHVKAVPGGWVSTALVRHTPPGTELLLGPPLGTMTIDHAADRDLLCVAGGTGLSPVKSIVEQAVRESAATPRRVYLFYGARQRDELYDLPDLWRLEDAYHGFQLIPVTSDDPAFDGMQGNVGRVAARYMPHADCEAYVAGPAEMVRETIRVLGKAGLPTERIHFDDALLAGRARAVSGR
jgi:NAD(P)H-flavin reductase/hemoglobin-like flavoprotein